MRTPSLRRVDRVIAIISPSLRGARLGTKRWRLTALRSRTECSKQCLFAINSRFFAVHRSSVSSAVAAASRPLTPDVVVPISSSPSDSASASESTLARATSASTGSLTNVPAVPVAVPREDSEGEVLSRVLTAHFGGTTAHESRAPNA